jgi:4-amino-4-deoxy-L-arabinose transferase-like glycosyltransferase
MINKQSKYTILLAVTAFCLCLPMLLFDNLIVRDVATRYAPMAEAFASGDWQNAFHYRIPPLFTIVSGTFARLFYMSGTAACELSSALFFSLTIFPLMALMRKVFNQKYAIWTTVMFICCSRLLRIGGMGLRDSAKCFFIVLAAYGLICFFRKYSWKGAVYCSLGCVGLALTRGDSLLFALLFLAAIAILELFKQKCFPSKSLVAGLIFIILVAPWGYYEYQQTGWPVMESRQAAVLNKTFNTEPTVPSIAVADIDTEKAQPELSEKEKKRRKEKKEKRARKKAKNRIKDFWKNLIKGFYPQYLLLIIPVLFFRIKKKKFSYEELILLMIVLIHTVGMIGQIAIADKKLFIYKRYLIVAAPLTFGWAAIGLRWLYDKTRRFSKLKYRWITKAVIIILITLSVLDAWSRVRKARINPFFYKTFKQYTGIDPKL